MMMASPVAPMGSCGPAAAVPWGPGCPREAAFYGVPLTGMDISWASNKRHVPNHAGALAPPTKTEMLQGVAMIRGVVPPIGISGGRRHFDRAPGQVAQSPRAAVPTSPATSPRGAEQRQRRHYQAPSSTGGAHSPSTPAPGFAKQEMAACRGSRLLVGRCSSARSLAQPAPQGAPAPRPRGAPRSPRGGSPRLSAAKSLSRLQLSRKDSGDDDDTSTMAGSSPCGVTPSGRSDLVSTPSSPMAWGGGSLDQVLSRSVAALQALQFVDEKTKDTGGEGTTSDLRRAIHDRRREQIDIAWEAVCKKYSLPADAGRRGRF